jgi:hypothetical protein
MGFRVDSVEGVRYKGGDLYLEGPPSSTRRYALGAPPNCKHCLRAYGARAGALPSPRILLHAKQNSPRKYERSASFFFASPPSVFLFLPPDFLPPFVFLVLMPLCPHSLLDGTHVQGKGLRAEGCGLKAVDMTVTNLALNLDRHKACPLQA